MNTELFNMEYNDQYIKVLDRVISNNRRLKIKVIKYLIEYKSKRPPAKTKQLQRLQYISIQKIKESLQIDFAVQLLNYRMKQFIRWFTYIMSKRLTLVSSRAIRLKRDYPYKKYGVGRMINVIFKPRSNEKQYVLDIYERNFNNLAI